MTKLESCLPLDSSQSICIAWSWIQPHCGVSSRSTVWKGNPSSMPRTQFRLLIGPFAAWVCKDSCQHTSHAETDLLHYSTRSFGWSGFSICLEGRCLSCWAWAWRCSPSLLWSRFLPFASSSFQVWSCFCWRALHYSLFCSGLPCSWHSGASWSWGQVEACGSPPASSRWGSSACEPLYLLGAQKPSCWREDHRIL